MALALGYLYTTEQALQKGLVDKVVPSEEIMSASHAVLTEWLQIPSKLHLHIFTVQSPWTCDFPQPTCGHHARTTQICSTDSQ